MAAGQKGKKDAKAPVIPSLSRCSPASACALVLGAERCSDLLAKYLVLGIPCPRRHRRPPGMEGAGQVVVRGEKTPRLGKEDFEDGTGRGGEPLAAGGGGQERGSLLAGAAGGAGGAPAMPRLPPAPHPGAAAGWRVVPGSGLILPGCPHLGGRGGAGGGGGGGRAGGGAGARQAAAPLPLLLPRVALPLAGCGKEPPASFALEPPAPARLVGQRQRQRQLPAGEAGAASRTAQGRAHEAGGRPRAPPSSPLHSLVSPQARHPPLPPPPPPPRQDPGSAGPGMAGAAPPGRGASAGPGS